MNRRSRWLALAAVTTAVALSPVAAQAGTHPSSVHHVLPPSGQLNRPFRTAPHAVPTSLAPRTPPPPIPGCAGGNNYSNSDFNNSWYWWDGTLQGGGSQEYLAAGQGGMYEYCALAIPGTSYQLIKNVTLGLCEGVNGTTDIYDKTCFTNPYRAFEEWTSGSSSVGALQFQNLWINENASCTGGITPLLATTGTNNQVVYMSCNPLDSHEEWDWLQVP